MMEHPIVPKWTKNNYARLQHQLLLINTTFQRHFEVEVASHNRTVTLEVMGQAVTLSMQKGIFKRMSIQRMTKRMDLKISTVRFIDWIQKRSREHCDSRIFWAQMKQSHLHDCNKKLQNRIRFFKRVCLVSNSNLQKILLMNKGTMVSMNSM